MECHIYFFFSWLTCFYCFPTNYSTQPSSRASSDRLSRGSQQMGCAKRGPPRQPWWTVRESQRSKPDGWRKVKLSGKDRKPMGTAVHVIMVLYIKKICNMHIYKHYIICGKPGLWGYWLFRLPFPIAIIHFVSRKIVWLQTSNNLKQLRWEPKFWIVNSDQK